MSDYKISISELRTRITFQEPTITEDAGAAQVAGYANVATVPTVWSRWINDHGQESVSNDADKSVQRATVTVRNRTDIQETWRVVKDNEAWQIISIDPVRDANQWIEMRVERVKGTV